MGLFAGFVIFLFLAALVIIGLTNLVLDRPTPMLPEAGKGKTPAFARAREVFEADCLSCHSVKASLPWYAIVPPAKQLIERDIREAMEEMDFDKRIYAAGKKPSAHTLKEIRKEISGNTMPPLIYKAVHWKSFPTPADKEAILAWVDEELAAITP